MTSINETSRQPGAATVSWRFARVALPLVLTVLAGCAGTPSESGDALARRAQARWDAVIGNEYEKAYAYYSPGYRSTLSLTDFILEMRLKKVAWTEATYLDRECKDKVCTLRFEVEYRVIKPVPGVPKYDGKSVVEDTWVMTDGQWWYVPKK